MQRDPWRAANAELAKARRQPACKANGRSTGRTSITYGRPSLKGRTPGKDIDPYEGKPWRTGADEATILTTDKPLKFGTLSLAPGTYTLNTQPDGPTWQLIVGKLGKPGQWGIPYQTALETGRAPMAVGKAAAPAETLTIPSSNSDVGT